MDKNLERGYIKIYVNRLNFILSVLPIGFKCLPLLVLMELVLCP